MKLRNFFVLVFLLSMGGMFFAQVAADPNNAFYADLQQWETTGIVGNLPAARPYPLQLVKTILEAVIEKGNTAQQQSARQYYSRFFGRVFSIDTQAEITTDTAADDSDTTDPQLGFALTGNLNYEVNQYLSASANAACWMISNQPSNEILPAGISSSRDIIDDDANVGPFYVLPSVNSSVAIGTTEYYLNAGQMRGSYGPFSDSVVVSSDAFHSGQFSFVVNKPSWGYDFSLYTLTATPDDDPLDYSSEKYLAVHSYTYHPVDWFSVSYLESIVWGERMELLYLLPLSPYMVSQGSIGLSDNVYMGGMFTVKPFRGLKIDGILYADDLSFKDIATFNFDTKWRLAGQTGVSYAPQKAGLLSLISFEYTMVTPYCYTHDNRHLGSDEFDYSSPNYQSYTHAGNVLGTSSMDPNSDRYSLKVHLTPPINNFSMDLIGTVIRHGNVNESLSDSNIIYYVTHQIDDKDYITDGSISNSTAIVDKDDSVRHIFQSSTPFLSQSTLQYIWQTGFTASYTLPVFHTGQQLVLHLGYLFEYNINKGINSNIYHYDSSLVNSSDEEILAAARKQYDQWLADAKGTAYNNYVTLSIEYKF